VTATQGQQKTLQEGSLSIIVQKYGGSSVADLARIKKVAAKVVATRERGHDVVVVVSAMGDTTDELLQMARDVHRVDQPNGAAEVVAVPIKGTSDLSRRELDMLLSVGERISMALLSMAIHSLGCEAISFPGSQSGIVTNDSHSSARIIEVRPYRIQDELRRGRVVIVAGYQGTSYKKEVTTLGRGGSDMTAVALAGALGAVACEIYSDVDGVFTGDPRVVLDARRLDSISAEEMLELSRHGAAGLHDEAVSYAKRHQIALHARSTHDPDSRGTEVRPDGWPDELLAAAAIVPCAVAALARIVSVSIKTAELVPAMKCVDRVFAGCGVLSLDAVGDTATLLLDPTNCPDVEAARETLAGVVGAAGLDTARGCVTLVGHDIGRTTQWPMAVRDCLNAGGLSHYDLRVREHSIRVLLPGEDCPLALNLCHRLIP